MVGTSRGEYLYVALTTIRQMSVVGPTIPHKHHQGQLTLISTNWVIFIMLPSQAAGIGLLNIEASNGEGLLSCLSLSVRDEG